MGSGVRPLKRLGQHFLKDLSIAQRIIESMEIGAGDHVLEIGPGEGVLTKGLIAGPAGRIVGVEIDRRLTPWLWKQFGQDQRFELFEEDFLKLDLASLIEGKKIRVVGNIPYSITTPILFRLLDHRQWIEDITLTVQKEVGERIVSLPGFKEYGIPSVLFQVFGRAEVLFPISRHAFYPVPEVDSIVLRVDFFKFPVYKIKDVQFFRRLVKTTFGQRRKMLKNTLKVIEKDEDNLRTVSIDLRRRPEDLSVTEFVQLSNELVRLNTRRSRGGDTVPKR